MRTDVDHYAVFGNPIAHSMSPKIQMYFAEKTGEKMDYKPVLVPTGEFKTTADLFFKVGSGCNITIPCKMDAFAYADELTNEARAAGAVNTLKKMDDGHVVGHNTDGLGLVADLKRLNINLKRARILILGAGGAARGIIAPIMAEEPASLTVTNRTVEKAELLAKTFEVGFSSFTQLNGRYDVIINATSSSLSNVLPPLPNCIFEKAEAAYDLMYSKEGSTVFTAKAEKLGCEKVAAGFGMLIMQAACSFYFWRAVTVDAEDAVRHFRQW